MGLARLLIIVDLTYTVIYFSTTIYANDNMLQKRLLRAGGPIPLPPQPTSPKPTTKPKPTVTRKSPRDILVNSLPSSLLHIRRLSLNAAVKQNTALHFTLLTSPSNFLHTEK
ncbi:hypothetical protein RIF29_28198 [Crotalaria pallida]|uniref:Uncharacterized protein n=1 Tax=Crotalaria pallida TaxID=3830 RepID=A0AAN9ESP5_CROPI